MESAINPLNASGIQSPAVGGDVFKHSAITDSLYYDILVLVSVSIPKQKSVSLVAIIFNFKADRIFSIHFSFF